MENISIFLKGAEALGVPKHDLFQTIDLFEKKNMTQVKFIVYGDETDLVRSLTLYLQFHAMVTRQAHVKM